MQPPVQLGIAGESASVGVVSEGSLALVVGMAHDGVCKVGGAGPSAGRVAECAEQGVVPRQEASLQCKARVGPGHITIGLAAVNDWHRWLLLLLLLLLLRLFVLLMTAACGGYSMGCCHLWTSSWHCGGGEVNKGCEGWRVMK